MCKLGDYMLAVLSLLLSVSILALAEGICTARTEQTSKQGAPFMCRRPCGNLW